MAHHLPGLHPDHHDPSGRPFSRGDLLWCRVCRSALAHGHSLSGRTETAASPQEDPGQALAGIQPWLWHLHPWGCTATCCEGATFPCAAGQEGQY